MGLFSKTEVPDPNKAAVAGAQADLQNYPFQSIINNVAKMGGTWTDPTTGQVYDFTGQGDADISAAMSEKMAQTLLDLQQNLGPAFVKQRLAELQAADPTGYAARQQLFDRIMADAEANPSRPMNTALQDAVKGELSKGGRLDARQIQEVQQGVRGKQLHNGIFLGNAPAAAESSALVNASSAMKDQRQQQATGILGSGVMPEDVQYQKVQQSLANLGAFTSGANPTAQFGSLTATGAAPMFQGSTNTASTNPNAAAQGQNNALSLYSTNQNWANSQMNPYLAGISGATSAYSLAQKAGWGN